MPASATARSLRVAAETGSSKRRGVRRRKQRQRRRCSSTWQNEPIETPATPESADERFRRNGFCVACARVEFGEFATTEHSERRLLLIHLPLGPGWNPCDDGLAAVRRHNATTASAGRRPATVAATAYFSRPWAQVCDDGIPPTMTAVCRIARRTPARHASTSRPATRRSMQRGSAVVTQDERLRLLYHA